jgi:hypothetical protein
LSFLPCTAFFSNLLFDSHEKRDLVIRICCKSVLQLSVGPVYCASDKLFLWCLEQRFYCSWAGTELFFKRSARAGDNLLYTSGCSQPRCSRRRRQNANLPPLFVSFSACTRLFTVFAVIERCCTHYNIDSPLRFSGAAKQTLDRVPRLKAGWPQNPVRPHQRRLFCTRRWMTALFATRHYLQLVSKPQVVVAFPKALIHIDLKQV